jgi:hypothetical protein
MTCTAGENLLGSYRATTASVLVEGGEVARWGGKPGAVQFGWVKLFPASKYHGRSCVSEDLLSRFRGAKAG